MGGVESVVRRRIDIQSIELTRPLPSLHDTAPVVRCLLRHDGDPICWTDVDVGAGGRIEPAEFARRLWETAGPPVAAHRRGRGLDDTVPITPCGYGVSVDAQRHRPVGGLSGADLTVVVATRDRPESLRETLQSICDMSVRPTSVIVVDSAPSDETTRELMATEFAVPTMTYIRADRPGLAIAHNAALPAIDTEIVAFTDDDVLVDELWAERLLRSFDRPEVGCVTGMIIPRELHTTPQQWIEESIGLQKGFEQRRFDLDGNHPGERLFPFTAGSMGSGANMAFRRSTLEAVGGFDEALGAGRPARGGDDLAAFYDVVVSGHQTVYEPSAIVSHRHHATEAAVRRTAYGYGVGLGAYLTRVAAKDLRQGRRMARLLCTRMPTVASHRSPKALPPDYPRSFTVLGFLGIIAGPFGYLRSRIQDRRRGADVPTTGIPS